MRHYAIRMAARLQRLPAYTGTVHHTGTGLDWTGTVHCLPRPPPGTARVKVTMAAGTART
jgi:hypothetical protein